MVHTYSINYTRRDKKGDFPKHGAKWWSWYTGSEEDDNEKKVQQVHLEWSLFRRGLAFYVTIDDASDYDIRAVIGVPFFGRFYLGLEHAKRFLRFIGMDWKTVRDKGSFNWARRIGIDIRLPVIIIYPWCHPTDWSRNKRNSIYINLKDAVLGRKKYSEGPATSKEIIINMPEGDYQGTYKKYVAHWKRPRWPIIDSVARVEIDIPEGIPFPGKGENSWDCGDDACFGITVSAKTIDEAVSKLIQSVIRDREHYGGASWTPPIKQINGGG